MSAATENVEHPVRTRRSGYRYLFTAKHHGGDPKASMWHASLGRDIEFSIFDQADLQEIVDTKRGWLYGILQDEDGTLRTIGTRAEQVAEFQPDGNVEGPWHGYPRWPLKVKSDGPQNRRRHPPKSLRVRSIASSWIDYKEPA